jgi:Rrf2 family transcriptional repressor of oqxAB
LLPLRLRGTLEYMVDVRFATALQVMLSLAYAERSGVKTLSSAQLAEGLAANPSLVRKLLVSLVRAGLVTSLLGKHGGVQLGRAAATITLRDIYVSALNEKPILSARPDVPHRCLISSNIEKVFAEISADIEDAVQSRLSARTLAQILDETIQREKGKRGVRKKSSSHSRSIT